MEFFILALLILLNGFFALSEIALVSANRGRLDEMKKKSRNAGFAIRLMDRPEEFLSAVQIGITLIGIISGVFGGLQLSGVFADVLEGYGVQQPYSDTIALVIVVGMITYLSIVIGELVPKTLAIRNATSIALTVAPVIFYFTRIVYPAVWLLSASTKWLLRLFGIKGEGDQKVTDEELVMMIRIAHRQGSISAYEAELYNNLFRFFDRRAKSIMTHRSEIVWLDFNDPPEIILETIKLSPYSKFLVCDEELDTIMGVLEVKHYISDYQKPGFDLRKILKEPAYIPESLSSQRILERFKESETHMAVVVDEYGSLAGIITLHDLIENIFGNLPTETESEAPKVLQRPDNTYLVDGDILVDELPEIIDMQSLREEGDEYTTLGGFMMTRIGRICTEGDVFRAGDYKFEVMDMDGVRVDKVLITVLDEEGA